MSRMSAPRPCGWSRAQFAYVVPPEPPTALPVTSLLDRFADEIADHGDIERACATLRIPVGTGNDLFRNLCKRLGENLQ